MEEGQIEWLRTGGAAARPEPCRPLRPVCVEAVRGMPDDACQAVEPGDQTFDAGAKAFAAGPTDRVKNAHDDLCERGSARRSGRRMPG